MLRTIARRVGMTALMATGLMVGRTPSVAADPQCQTEGFCSGNEIECGGDCANNGGVYSYECYNYKPGWCESSCTCSN